MSRDTCREQGRQVRSEEQHRVWPCNSSHEGSSLISHKTRWGEESPTSLCGRANIGCEVGGRVWGSPSAGLFMVLGGRLVKGGRKDPSVRAAPPTEQAVAWECTKHLTYSQNSGGCVEESGSKQSGSTPNYNTCVLLPTENFFN